MSNPWDASSRSTTGRLVALTVATVFGAVFIARSSFEIGGARYFSLFDDAMISMRFARNLADGHGLTWNPAEAAVEGYTNFLWTLWMAAIHALGVPDRLASLPVMITGLLLTLIIVRLAWSLTTSITATRTAPVLAALFVGLYYPLAFWALRGMEVGLLAAVILAGVLVVARIHEQPTRSRDPLLLGALLVAGILTRTDFLLPAVVLAAAAGWAVGRDRRFAVLAALFGVIVATVAAHTGLRLVIYGQPLPNTYYLKLGEGLDVARIAWGALMLAFVGVAHLWSAVAVGIVGLLDTVRRSPVPVVLATIVLVQAAYSAYVGGDAWEFMAYANRYLAVAAPGLLVLAALGIDALAAGRWLRTGSGLMAAAAAAVLVAAALPIEGLEPVRRSASIAVVALVVGILGLLRGPAAARGRAVTVVVAVIVWAGLNAVPLLDWARDGGWLVDDDARLAAYGLAVREATAESDRVAVHSAGAIPYFSHRHSVDLLGKVDPVIATGPLRDDRPSETDGFYPGHMKWDYEHSLGRLRPELVAQLMTANPHECEGLLRWGYLHVTGPVHVHEDATHIDPGPLLDFHGRQPSPCDR